MESTRPSVTLILPSEGYRIEDFVTAATHLDIDVSVATDAHHGLAEDMGSRLIPIDFGDQKDAAIRIAGASPHMDAIIAIDDRGVGIAAQASALRGIAHNPPAAVHATRDKSVARKLLANVVPQPGFAVLGPGDDEVDLVASFKGPVVIKPVGLAGSVGVIRVDDPDHAPDTVAEIRTIQANHGYPFDHPLLVESYVDGAEVSIEGLLTGGTWDTLAIFDKPDPMDGPHFPETHYITPTRHSDVVVAAIERSATIASAHLGLVQGPVHAEFRIAGETPVLLELAARSIGGLCGRALRFGLADTSLEEILLRNAMGERVRGTRLAPGASGVSMVPVPRSGTFRGMVGVEDASTVANVTAVEVGKMIGSHVDALPHDSTYLGFVFARAKTAGEVEQALRSAIDRLDVVID